MSMKGTKTLKNLMVAFAGESQARMRYNYYASVADKEGYKQIKNIFTETADNEKEHAKRFFKLALAGTNNENPMKVDIEASYPLAYSLTTTLDNLRSAAEGEHEEWSADYPHFADIAAEEGFPEVANVFRKVAEVEARHEARFNKLAENIVNKTVFKKDKEVEWKCGNCGYVHKGTQAPDSCPACIHPQAYFEVFIETY